MNLEETREFFKADRFAAEVLGAVIEEAEDGFSRCTLAIRPEHRNAVGAVMGALSLPWRILPSPWRPTAAGCGWFL